MSRQATAHVSKQQSQNFYAQDAKRTLEILGVQREQGLSANEASRRLKAFGPNLLRAKRRRTNWAILVDQFRSLLTLLLGVATAISFAVGDYAEGMAIIAVILLNAAIGFFAERKAVSSIEALRRLGATVTRVRRDSVVTPVPAEYLVPSDIVLLEAGALLPPMFV